VTVDLADKSVVVKEKWMNRDAKWKVGSDRPCRACPAGCGTHNRPPAPLACSPNVPSNRLGAEAGVYHVPRSAWMDTDCDVPKSRASVSKWLSTRGCLWGVSIARQSREHVIVPQAKAAFRLSP
jgi:hypothetical protein